MRVDCEECDGFGTFSAGAGEYHDCPHCGGTGINKALVLGHKAAEGLREVAEKAGKFRSVSPDPGANMANALIRRLCLVLLGEEVEGDGVNDG